MTKAFFCVWAALGFIRALLFVMDSAMRPYNAADLTYVAVLMLIWIGGMLFFGLANLMGRDSHVVVADFGPPSTMRKKT